MYKHFMKSKGKLSLHLTMHHAVKTYWGVEVGLHAFFDLDTRCKWVAENPCA